jgi:hypothetical protein
MSLKGLFRQTLTLYNQSSYDEYGNEVVGNGTTLRGRFQATTKQKLLPNGTLKNILAIAYVPSDTDVEIDDKITYDSVNYKVFGRYEAIDGNGKINHIKLELVKWQI